MNGNKMNKTKKKRKGFTLIELLAVIVVLAIVLVVTIPSIINSMNNAKLSQLHNLSVSVAKWYNEAVESDSLGLTNILGEAKAPNDGHWHCLAKVNGKGYYGNQQEPIYIGANEVPDSNYNLASKYGLNIDDVILYKNTAVFPIDYLRNNEFCVDNTEECLKDNNKCKNSTSACFNMTSTGKLQANISLNNSNYTNTSFGYSNLGKVCSSIRIVNGKAEVLLIAKEGGKFDTGQTWRTYASSSGVTGYDSVLEPK